MYFFNEHVAISIPLIIKVHSPEMIFSHENYTTHCMTITELKITFLFSLSSIKRGEYCWSMMVMPSRTAWSHPPANPYASCIIPWKELKIGPSMISEQISKNNRQNVLRLYNLQSTPGRQKCNWRIIIIEHGVILFCFKWNLNNCVKIE